MALDKGVGILAKIELSEEEALLLMWHIDQNIEQFDLLARGYESIDTSESLVKAKIYRKWILDVSEIRLKLDQIAF